MPSSTRLLLLCLTMLLLCLLTPFNMNNGGASSSGMMVHAQEKSFNISSIHTTMNVAEDSCNIVIHETITFTFIGPYSSVGRFFPKEHSYGLTITNIKVSSNDVYVTNAGYLVNDDNGTGKYLVWDFTGVTGGVRKVTFSLSFSMTGIFKNVNKNENTLYYSYKWNAPVGVITADVFVPITANATEGSGLSWTPRNDGRYVPYGKVSFRNSAALLINSKYDISVTVPVSAGGTSSTWANCKTKPLTFGGVVAIVVIVVVLCCVCVVCSLICSVLQAIKRGLFPWAHTHHSSGYYQHGSHHHHHSHHGGNSGYQNIRSASGSSGFAV